MTVTALATKDARYDVLFLDRDPDEPVDDNATAPDAEMNVRTSLLAQPFRVNARCAVSAVRLWARQHGDSTRTMVVRVRRLSKPWVWLGEVVYEAWVDVANATLEQVVVTMPGLVLTPGDYVLTVAAAYDPGHYLVLGTTGIVYTKDRLVWPMWMVTTFEPMDQTATEERFAFEFDTDRYGSVEYLPLMLAEQGGGLAFSASARPPITGKVVGGDIKESDLSQAWTVRTQNDWRGGRGQEVAEGATDRFGDGLVDTRFANQVILPPAPKLNNVGGGGVGFVPTDGDTRIVEKKATSASGSRLVNVPNFVDTAAGVRVQTGMKGKVVKATWGPASYTQHVKDANPSAGQAPGADSARLEYDQVSNSPPDNQQSYIMAAGYGYWNQPTWQTSEAYVLSSGQLGWYFVAHDYNGRKLPNGQKLRYLKVALGLATPGTPGTYVVNCRIHAANPSAGGPGTALFVADRQVALTTSGYTEVEFDFGVNGVTFPAAGTYYFVLNWAHAGGLTVRNYTNATGLAIYANPNVMTGTWTRQENRSIWFKMLSQSEYSYGNRRGNDLAQSFTSAEPISLAKLRLTMRKAGTWRGNPTWAVELQTDDNGWPSGNALAGCRWVKPVTLAATWQTITLAPTQSTTLAAGTRYWVVLKVAGESANGTDGTHQAVIEVECDQAAKYAEGSAAKAYVTDLTMGDWSEQARDLYFHAGDFVKVAVKAAQRISVPAATSLGDLTSLSVVAVRVRASSVSKTGNGTVAVQIWSNVNDAPGTLLVNGTMNLTPTGGWYQTSLARTLAASTDYWIVVTPDAPASTDAITLNLLTDQAEGYAGGAGWYAEGSGNPLTYGAWQDGDADVFFQLGTGSPVVWGPYFRSGIPNRTRVAQQFLVGAVGGGGLVVTKVMLYVRREVWAATSSPTLTLSIWTDNDDSPGSLVVGASGAITEAMLPQMPGWISVPVAVTLSQNTTYWTVLEAGGLTVGAAWLADGNGSNLSRPAWLCKMQTASGATWGGWTDQDAVCFFLVNDGGAFAFGVTVTPVEHSGEWYAASGLHVYKFNRTTQLWALFNTFAQVVTSLEVFNGEMYAAMGDAADMQKWNGSAWAAVSGKQYTHLLSAGGYLNALKAVGGATALAYWNGTAWTNLACGTADHAFTGMAWFHDVLVVFSTTEVLSHTGQYSVRVIDYRQMRSAKNGRQAVAWNGALIYPVRNSLYAWDGSAVQGMGPDLDEGMPAGEQGAVSAMVSTPNWLFVALDAGASGRSTILARGRQGGWHKLARMDVAGQRVRAMGYEAFTNANGTPRLHFFAGSQAWYVELPDLTDNPWGYSGAAFRTDGWVESSRLLGELAQIDKDLQSVGVRSQGCSEDQYVQVYLEVDQSGQWWDCGRITRSPWQVLELATPAVASKVVAQGSTDQVIVIDPSGNLDDVQPGQFLRIGVEVGQVDDLDTGTEQQPKVTLVRPLVGGAPAPGTIVYSSRPVGREARYRLVLRTNNQALTPRVEGVSVTYQEMFLDKFSFSMTVRLESGTKHRTGGKYPLTPGDVREEMYKWLRRPTPFTMIGPDGRRWRVKMMGFSEGSFTRETPADRRADEPGVGSLMTVNLVEV